VTLAQAALAEPLAVVTKGLRRLTGSATPSPKRCAVIGAGTIGHLAARVLALRGHSVTVIDQEPGRLALLEDIARTSTSMSDLSGFDWLIEATGNQAVLSSVLSNSRTGATLLLLGLPYGREGFTFESIVSFDKAVVGSVGSSGADFEEALATLASIDTRPFERTSYRLEEFERAWEAVRSRQHIKVMLHIDQAAT
jgi:threonine dehydrogenase-like Zn-dependent dehydrogenase